MINALGIRRLVSRAYLLSRVTKKLRFVVEDAVFALKG